MRVLLLCGAVPDYHVMPLCLEGNPGCCRAGFMRMRMCLAIMNDKGMAGVLRPHHNLGVNARWVGRPWFVVVWLVDRPAHLLLAGQVIHFRRLACPYFAYRALLASHPTAAS